MAEKINGWTISQRDGLWMAVNSDGIVGVQDVVKSRVEAFAKRNKAETYPNR